MRLVVLTGAGISAESGIPTFRGSDGLWEGHAIEDVATPEAWSRNPQKVLEFYNLRRQVAVQAKPNRGHQLLAELERFFEVHVITQNVDNLHERAGSTRVLHLHGSLFEARSTSNSSLIVPIIGTELNIGDLCPLGSQLRPNIVWFGEDVPLYPKAVELAAKADFFVVAGTSLQVYPAAGLVREIPPDIPGFLVDPHAASMSFIPGFHLIAEPASTGLQKVSDQLMKFLS